MLINPYYSGVIPKNFPKIYDDIAKYYDRLFDMTVSDYAMGDYGTTPRFNFEENIRVTLKDIYYYIDFLYDNGPSTIIDVGCGECIWKKWYPNIIGFDPKPSKYSAADFIDYFDEEFSKNHTKHWDCGMALNSIHFIPWDKVPDQINAAMNMVNDRFLFTFNFAMIHQTPSSDRMVVIKLFDDIIKSLDYNIILIDYPDLNPTASEKNIEFSWDGINGDVRFILEHKKHER
jgi:hypothetical protein